MCQTLSKMRMNDMATIDKLGFEIVNFLKYPGRDRVNVQ